MFGILWNTTTYSFEESSPSIKDELEKKIIVPQRKAESFNTRSFKSSVDNRMTWYPIGLNYFGTHRFKSLMWNCFHDHPRQLCIVLCCPEQFLGELLCLRDYQLWFFILRLRKTEIEVVSYLKLNPTYINSSYASNTVHSVLFCFWCLLTDTELFFPLLLFKILCFL